MNITEHAVDAETLESIQDCASEAAAMLGLDAAIAAVDAVAAVDEFVYQWQKGNRPPVDEDVDLSLILGSLWGEQLVHALGWQWAGVTFHDHSDVKAVGVFSPDRALAIYPFHFIYGCMEHDASVTILLSYNMLHDAARVPSLPARGYENWMEGVHHIVPRD